MMLLRRFLTKIPGVVYVILLIGIGMALFLRFTALGSGGLKLTTILSLVMLLIAAFGVFGLLFSMKRSSKSKRGKDLEGGMLRQHDRLLEREAAEEKARLNALRDQWDEAKRFLRKAGDEYALPWFAIIGAPGSGKSTSLRYSGIDFPFNKLTGLGGTRNCDFWFSNEAVILDTAGRLTVAEADAVDHAEWEEFLKLLKKARPAYPINGVIVAIPADSLLTDSEEDHERTARLIKEKLDQFAEVLDFRLPVYILVTKADKIRGFTDFFAEMSRDQQRQLIGWSHLGDPGLPVTEEQFEDAFEELVQKLTAFRPTALKQAYETVQDSRPVERALAFPDALRSIGPGLQTYLSVLCQGSVFQASHFFRGFYLSSGVQELSILEAMKMKRKRGVKIKEHAGKKRKGEEGAAVMERGLFIRDFYGKVFQEKTLARPFQKAVERYQMAAQIAWGVGTLVVALMAGYWAYDANEESKEVAALAKSLESFRGADVPAPVAEDVLTGLTKLREPLFGFRDAISGREGAVRTTKEQVARHALLRITPGIRGLGQRVDTLAALGPTGSVPPGEPTGTSVPAALAATACAATRLAASLESPPAPPASAVPSDVALPEGDADPTLWPRILFQAEARLEKPAAEAMAKDRKAAAREARAVAERAWTSLIAWEEAATRRFSAMEDPELPKAFAGLCEDWATSDGVRAEQLEALREWADEQAIKISADKAREEAVLELARVREAMVTADGCGATLGVAPDGDADTPALLGEAMGTYQDLALLAHGFFQLIDEFATATRPRGGEANDLAATLHLLASDQWRPEATRFDALKARVKAARGGLQKLKAQRERVADPQCLDGVLDAMDTELRGLDDGYEADVWVQILRTAGTQRLADAQSLLALKELLKQRPFAQWRTSVIRQAPSQGMERGEWEAVWAHCLDEYVGVVRRAEDGLAGSVSDYLARPGDAAAVKDWFDVLRGLAGVVETEVAEFQREFPGGARMLDWAPRYERVTDFLGHSLGAEDLVGLLDAAKARVRAHDEAVEGTANVRADLARLGALWLELNPEEGAAPPRNSLREFVSRFNLKQQRTWIPAAMAEWERRREDDLRARLDGGLSNAWRNYDVAHNVFRGFPFTGGAEHATLKELESARSADPMAFVVEQAGTGRKRLEKHMRDAVLVDANEYDAYVEALADWEDFARVMRNGTELPIVRVEARGYPGASGFSITSDPEIFAASKKSGRKAVLFKEQEILWHPVPEDDFELTMEIGKTTKLQETLRGEWWPIELVNRDVRADAEVLRTVTGDGGSCGVKLRVNIEWKQGPMPSVRVDYPRVRS